MRVVPSVVLLVFLVPAAVVAQPARAPEDPCGLGPGIGF